jgi:hypothetical protein
MALGVPSNLLKKFHDATAPLFQQYQETNPTRRRVPFSPDRVKAALS